MGSCVIRGYLMVTYVTCEICEISIRFGLLSIESMFLFYKDNQGSLIRVNDQDFHFSKILS